MARSPSSTSPNAPLPRLCPTCGTRVGAAATKCMVCGTDLTAVTGNTGATRPVRATQPQPASPLSRQPISLSTVVVITVVVMLALVGGFLILAASGAVPGLVALVEQPAVGTPTATPTVTLPPTATPSATPTETPLPTPTPLPPRDYVIASGDTCIKIALQFDVTVASIVNANTGVIDANCTFLTVGRTIKVPQPTHTPTPLPTATLPAGAATQIPRVTYTVRSGDTLVGIARFYAITVADIMEINGLTNAQNIREGQILVIPIERAVTPGPTPTPSPPPPYPAPALLVPNNGQTFAAGDAGINLQWVTVGQLRPNERYLLVVEDVTCACARFFRQLTVETRAVLPLDYRPPAGETRIFRWTVTTVRLTGANATDTQPAGATSPDRYFSWSGSGGPASTLTP